MLASASWLGMARQRIEAWALITYLSPPERLWDATAIFGLIALWTQHLIARIGFAGGQITAFEMGLLHFVGWLKKERQLLSMFDFQG